MGRPVLLALRVVAVAVHGITRIHGGQKQKDIKTDPNLRSHHQCGCISNLRVYAFFGLTDSLPYCTGSSSENTYNIQHCASVAFISREKLQSSGNPPRQSAPHFTVAAVHVSTQCQKKNRDRSSFDTR